MGWDAPPWAWILLGLVLVAGGLYRIVVPERSQLEADMDRLRYESTSRFGRTRVPQRAFGLLTLLAGVFMIMREAAR
jgi:hypothetical protein